MKTTTISLSREALAALREIRDRGPFNLSAAVSILLVREADRLRTTQAPGEPISRMVLLPAAGLPDPCEP